MPEQLVLLASRIGTEHLWLSMTDVDTGTHLEVSLPLVAGGEGLEALQALASTLVPSVIEVLAGSDV